MLTGLKPGTFMPDSLLYIHIESVDGLVYDYWDGTHWTVKTNTYNTPGLSVAEDVP